MLIRSLISFHLLINVEHTATFNMKVRDEYEPFLLLP